MTTALAPTPGVTARSRVTVVLAGRQFGGAVGAPDLGGHHTAAPCFSARHAVPLRDLATQLPPHIVALRHYDATDAGRHNPVRWHECQVRAAVGPVFRGVNFGKACELAVPFDPIACDL